MRNKVWSMTEVDFLRRVYPAGGVKAFRKKFPARTIKAVWLRVSLLGISKSAISWKPDEVAYLKQVYPEGGFNGFKKRFSGRSSHAIAIKAHRLKILKINRKAMGCWNSAEISYLKKVYLSDGVTAFRARYPKRTYCAVVHCARKLGLQRRIAFSADEINLLRRTYPFVGAREFLSRYPYRHKMTVLTKAFHLGLKVRDVGILRAGKLNPSWLGGLSFEPYAIGFNHRLKERVRIFYQNCCLNCGSDNNGLRLCVHHIDYVKKHCFFDNLVPLCSTCHLKSNVNRGVWKVHLRFLQEQFRISPERGACLAPSAPLTHSNFEPTSPLTAKRFSALPKLRMDGIARRDGCA